jgi:hypothetical protein
MQMVVADTMKKRPFIAIFCMHKMRTRAISLGYGGYKSQSLSSMVKHKPQFMFQCIHSSNSNTCTTTATHNCHCLLRILNGYQVEATDLVVRVPILLQFNRRFTFDFTVEIIHQYCLLFGADSIDVLLTVCLWRAWQHEKCNLYTWCMLMVTERACSCVQRTGKPSLQ